MLSIKNVTIEQKSGRKLLNNVTLEIKPGDYVSVCGEKQSTTALISVLGGLQDVTSGEVLIDGIEISKYTLSQLTTLRREKFAYLLGEGSLDMSLSVRENVELPLLFAEVDQKEIDARVERAVQIVGLGDFIDKDVNILTEWQKNKLNLAMILVKNPQVMILEEPLRVFDRTRVEELLGLFSALNKDGVTIVLASEDAQIASGAKRKIVIAGDGVITELKKERAPRKPAEEKPKAKKTTRAKKTKKSETEEVKPEVAEEEPVVETVVDVDEKPAKTKSTKKKAVSVESEQLEIPELDVKPVKSSRTRTKKTSTTNGGEK